MEAASGSNPQYLYLGTSAGQITMDTVINNFPPDVFCFDGTNSPTWNDAVPTVKLSGVQDTSTHTYGQLDDNKAPAIDSGTATIADNVSGVAGMNSKKIEYKFTTTANTKGQLSAYWDIPFQVFASSPNTGTGETSTNPAPVGSTWHIRYGISNGALDSGASNSTGGALLLSATTVFTYANLEINP
jgi:hypothetical protein